MTQWKPVNYDDIETFTKYLKGRTVVELEEILEEDGAYTQHYNGRMLLDDGTKLNFYSAMPCGCGCDIGGDISVNKDIQLPLGPIESVETGGAAADEDDFYDISWLNVTVAGNTYQLVTCYEGSSGYGDYVLAFHCTVTEPTGKGKEAKQ